MAKRALYSIVVGGQDISLILSPILISLTVSDKAGQSSDTATIEIDDTDGRVVMPPTGAEITIRIGWSDSGLVEVFKGKVDEVKASGARGGGRVLRISAKGVDTKGKAKEPQSRHMDNMTLEDAMKKAGEAAGVSRIRIDPDLAKIRRDYWSMDAESFLHFGDRLAREVGGTFKVRGSEAVLAKKSGGKSPGGKEMPTITATWGDNLLDWDIAPILGRPQFSNVRGRYFDRKEAKWKEVEVQVQNTDATAKLTRRAVSADEDEAKGGAGNDKQDSEDKKGGGSATIDGSTQARPEGRCIIAGARPGIDGEYKIESVEHSLNRGGGWITKLDLKTPSGEAGKDNRKAANRIG
jgi:phage protein D